MASPNEADLPRRISRRPLWIRQCGGSRSRRAAARGCGPTTSTKEGKCGSSIRVWARPRRSRRWRGPGRSSGRTDSR